MGELRNYKALLGTFLLAAGCGELAYDDFVEEEAEIECEIREACGGELETCTAGSSSPSLGDCKWFRPTRGQRCLNAMDEAVEQAYDDPETCEAWQGAANPLSECEDDEVTRRRRGFSCFMSRLAGGGRPIRERGAPVLAPILTVGVVGRLSSAVERAVAGWLEVARYEHASIAAFSRAAMELMSLGAPVALVARCHEAALDEARHADMTLQIANSLGGREHRFGALPLLAFTPRSLREVATDALLEGCWGEGTAAIVARVGASRADGRIRDVLRTIGCEETQHAALAWATVRWAVDQMPGLLHDLQSLVQTELARPRSSHVPEPSDHELAAYGLVGPQETQLLAGQVLGRLVAPVLGAMRTQHRRNSLPQRRSV